MAEFENSVGASDEWLTPKHYFDRIGLTFDLDPCACETGDFVPAKKRYFKSDDGLKQPWHGLVFCNPPYGGRFAHVPWIAKCHFHGNGICLVRAYTSSSWFHAWAPHFDAWLLPTSKIKFVRPDGSVGGQPGHGSIFLSMGATANEALRRSGLGLFLMTPAEWRGGGGISAELF